MIKKHKGLKIFCLIAAFIILSVSILWIIGIPQNGENPHHLVLFQKNKIETLESVKRLDEDGYLYTMDYTADYYDFLPKSIPAIVRLVRETGCTGFFTKNEENHYILCRNFDYPHLDKNGNITGCSVAIKCAPENGYRSIAFADAALMLEAGIQYVNGCLDDGKTDTSLLLTLPWLCMDGVNEAGLSVSIMSIDPKEDEAPINQNEKGKEQIIMPELLRYILDSCASVEEAIEMAESKNLVNAAGNMYHLFVNDINGRSVVIEWRNNQMMVIESDAATNFYLGSDDAQDSYKDGYFKEAWTGPAITQKEYHYGYGHGYERFKTVVTALDGKDSISTDEAQKLLFATKQKYSGEPTSDTRYSVIYDLDEFSAVVWTAEDEENSYVISFDD